MARNGGNGATSWAMEMAIRLREEAIMAGATPDGDSIGRAVAREIRYLASQGDEMAQFAIETALTTWCVQLAGRACRQTKVEAAIGWNGEVTRHAVPARVSIPARQADGTTQAGAGQYPLWVDVPRDEFFTKLALWERDLDVRGKNVAVMRRCAALLAQYPSASTIREACAMDGRDVDEFLSDWQAV